MVRQYVGARYVPKFATPVEWAADTSYEALTIVTFNNASYTSKVPVPPTVGNPANNPQYWALTGNYNAQVEEYRQEVVNTVNSVQQVQEKLNTQVEQYRQEVVNTVNSVQQVQEKLNTYIKQFPTPEEFGAVGDGITDDTNAITNFLESDSIGLYVPHKTYLIKKAIITTKPHTIISSGGTFKFDENTEVNNIRLLKFEHIDGLYIYGLNINITAINSTPFVNDGGKDHDGLLVDITDCNNVHIDHCNFSVIDNGTNIPCTPLWVRNTGNNIVIVNSIINNSGYGKNSGGLWFYGDFTNVFLSNLCIINSTVDELFILFGNTNKQTIKLNNSTLISLARNDQITSSSNNITCILNNCKIILATNVVNYRVFKTYSNGELIVNSCHITASLNSAGSLFSANNNSNIIATNNIINCTFEDTSDAAIVYGDGGEVKLERNIIYMTGPKVEVMNLNSETSILKLISNHFINKSDTVGFRFLSQHANTLYMINNIFDSANHDITSYLGSTGIPTKKIYQNAYITTSIPTDINNTTLPA